MECFLEVRPKRGKLLRVDSSSNTIRRITCDTLIAYIYYQRLYIVYEYGACTYHSEASRRPLVYLSTSCMSR
jgi:hypothetical protein